MREKRMPVQWVSFMRRVSAERNRVQPCSGAKLRKQCVAHQEAAVGDADIDGACYTLQVLSAEASDAILHWFRKGDIPDRFRPCLACGREFHCSGCQVGWLTHCSGEDTRRDPSVLCVRTTDSFWRV